MKEIILQILNEYLLIFPEEKESKKQLFDFLENNNDDEIIDWNNFKGHLVASGIIYAKKEKKFLVLYHRDMKLFVSPGGHMDNGDKNPLETVKREIVEETGLSNFKQYKISENELIPINIEIHDIKYNERLNLSAHYHFDFKYLFIIDKIVDIVIDKDESSEYRWVDVNEIRNNTKLIEIIKKM